MAVQASLTNQNFSLILSGNSLVKDNETLLQDAGRTTALAPFTVMGKVAVSVPTSFTADEGNTGTGTVTAVAPAFGGPPRVGIWQLECVGAVTHGGVFKLIDPGGNIVANDLTMTPGDGGATVFFAGGLTFTITDATDFIVGDLFTLTVAAVEKWTPFDPDAVNGAQTPRGIYLGDSVTAAALVAGDVTGAPILVGGAAVTLDTSLLVFENSAVMTTSLVDGRTVFDALAQLGLFGEAVIDIDALEN